MSKVIRSISIALLAACFLLLAASSLSAAEKGKIPITTSSPQGLQLFLQGRDLAESLQVQESRQYFEHAAQNDPNFALAYMYLAQAQPNVKGFFANLDSAVALVDKVSPGEKLWILGTQAGAFGRPMEQLENWQKLVTLFPDDERAHGLLGLYYFGQQQWEKAIPELNKAIEIAPNFSQPYNQLGYANRFLGNYESAEKAFKKYIELIPHDPNPYDSYGELLMKMGRFDESIVQYKKALEQNPNFVASHTGIALNLTLKGDHTAALSQLKKLHEMARNDGERRIALFAMTATYIDAGNMDEALKKMDEQFALAKKIDDAGAMAGDLGLIGNILLEMGKSDAAMAQFEEALKIVKDSNLSAEVKDNTRRQFLYNSATVALEKGDFATAKAKLEEFNRSAAALNAPLQIAQGHQLAGMIALKEKNFAKALEELKQASTDFNPYNFYRMAMAYQGLGDKQKAKEYFSKAAHFNGLDGLTYALIRTKALKMLEL